MNMPAVRAVVIVGVAYAAVGIVTAELARQAASHDGVVGWRWAAWVVSAVAFGAHIVYEQVGLHSSTKVTALHVAAATALGAFGLAAAANIHALSVSPNGPPRLLFLSLAIWPAITGVPAFVVALAAAMLLAGVRRRPP